MTDKAHLFTSDHAPGISNADVDLLNQVLAEFGHTPEARDAIDKAHVAWMTIDELRTAVKSKLASRTGHVTPNSPYSEVAIKPESKVEANAAPVHKPAPKASHPAHKTAPHTVRGRR